MRLSVLLIGLVLAVAAGAADAPAAGTFTLREYLGQTWSNEVVRFPLDAAAAGDAAAYRVLDDAGASVPFQFVAGEGAGRAVALLVDLKPYAETRFRLERAPAPATAATATATDLRVESEKAVIRITNALTGIEIPTAQGSYANGPFLRLKLRSGTWIGGSRLLNKAAIESYEANVTASGPVFVEVECRYRFAGGRQWQVTYRLAAREPAVLITESCNLQDGSAWQLLVSPGFTPTHTLFRDQKRVFANKLSYDGGAPLSLAAWPVWWNPSSVGFLGLFRLPPGAAVVQANGRTAIVATPQSDKAMKEVKLEDKDKLGEEPEFSETFEQEEKKAKKAVEAADDFLAAAAGHGEVWANPGDDGQAKNIPLCTGKNGELFFSCALAGPGRRWLLAALGTQENLVADAELPAAQKLMVKHCETPLDEVKDMVLEWPSTSAGDYPRLIQRRSEYAGRGEVKASSEQRRAQKAVDAPGPRARKLLDPALRVFLGAVDQPAQSMHTIHRCERIMSIAVAADMWLGSDVLTREERNQVLGYHAVQWGRPMLTDADVFSDGDIRYARAQIAFLGYKLASPDYYSLERNYRANPNMTAARYCTMAILASLVPDHPRAREWAQGGMAEVERELKEWTGPNGGWIEAPHYQTAAMAPILLLAFATRNAGFADYLNDPRIAKAMRYLARISTPPDPRFDNRRHFPPAGNTYQFETNGLFGVLAKACRDSNRELADELQWTWIQQGRNRNSGIGGDFYNAVLYADFAPALAPRWGSEYFPGSGVVLRSGFPGERETYLWLLQGWFYEHYDVDRGSFEFWGKGRPLCLDWGYSFKMGRVPAWLHNQVDVGGVGEIRKFQPFETADYLHSRQGGWDRQILLVKDQDPAGPNYLVMRDAVAQPAASWWLWLYTEQSPQLLHDTVAVTGVHDVDLDIWLAPGLSRHLKAGPFRKREAAAVAQPSLAEEAPPLAKGANEDILDAAADLVKEETAAAVKPVAAGTWIQTNTQTVECFDMGTQKQRPLTQEGLNLPVTREAPVFCVLWPRLKTEKPATFTSLADGRGVKVVHATGTDYVFLATVPFEFSEGDVSFKGTAGIIRARGKAVDLTLSEGGEIAFGDRKLVSAEPASRQ